MRLDSRRYRGHDWLADRGTRRRGAGEAARAGPGPDGILGTLLLGLAGSLVGGFLGNLLVAGDQTVNPAGLIGSVIGAVLVLLIYRAVAAAHGLTGPPGAYGASAPLSRGARRLREVARPCSSATPGTRVRCTRPGGG